jgi:hypothetical protein
MFFRKPKPALTETEKVASAAAFLARHAAKRRDDAQTWAIRRKCAELRDGPVVPITPRDINIAPVRARRENAHG